MKKIIRATWMIIHGHWRVNLDQWIDRLRTLEVDLTLHVTLLSLFPNGSLHEIIRFVREEEEDWLFG